MIYKKINSLVAKLTALSMVLSMFATVSPAYAAAPTKFSDVQYDTATGTDNYVQGTTAVRHEVNLTLPSGVSNGTFTMTYASFSNFTFNSGYCDGGGTVTNNGTGTNVVNVTLSGCDYSTPGVVHIAFTGDNPGSAGAYTVTFGGTAGVTGSVDVSIHSFKDVLGTNINTPVAANYHPGDASVPHHLRFVVNTSAVDGDTITLTYEGNWTGFNITGITSYSGVIVDNGTTGNVISLAYSGGDGFPGDQIDVDFTGTNDTNGGAHAVTFGGTAGVSGQAALALTQYQDNLSDYTAGATGVTHTVYATMPSAVTTGSLESFTYNDGSWALTNGALTSATCSGFNIGGSTSISSNVISTNLNSCYRGSLIVFVFTGDNSTTGGANSITASDSFGYNKFTGTFYVTLTAPPTATTFADTLTREKISVASDHSLLVDGFGSGVSEGVSMTFTGFTGNVSGNVSAVCASGTAVDNSSSGQTVSLTLTGCTAPMTVTITGLTNPGSAGSYAVTVSGTAVAGAFAIPITNDDQISVTATVNPYITFQVQATAVACDHGDDDNSVDHSDFATNGGIVAFGVVTPTAVSMSDVGGVNHVCTFVSTNATGGYALTVKSLNGGLTNGSQLINDQATEVADGTGGPQVLVPGTEGYGMCLSTDVAPNSDNTLPSGNDLTPVGDFYAGGDCFSGDTTVAQLTNATQTIGSASGPVQEGAAQWSLKTSIAATTGAGSYTDTLTFIATGTF